jgi:ferrous iron transport protein A
MEFISKSRPPDLTLADLPPGARAVVTGVSPDLPVGRRLLDLGFVPNTPIRVLRRAPLGDPISYELRGMRICLRKEEARNILVVREDPDTRSRSGPGDSV